MKITLEKRIARLERLLNEGNEDLHAMLFSGKPNQIVIAVRSGYNINEPEFHRPGGMTALMAAALDCQVNAARSLIRLGADVNAKTSEGKTALDYAIYSGCKEIEDMLINNGAVIERRCFNKNEIFEFNRPIAKDEAPFVTSLFAKYSSLKKILTPLVGGKKDNDKFNLLLKANDNYYDGIRFLISSDSDDRNEMQCIALDKDGSIIDSLDSFNLDKDINVVALFILEQLENSIDTESYDRRVCKNESIPLNTFNCEQFAQMIQNNLKGFNDVFVDVVDDNADYGFINVSIECDGKEDDYGVTANEYNEYEVMNNNKKVGECNSLNDAAKMVADHFKKTYLNK